MQHVVFHNIGHHEIYFGDGAPDSELVRPSGGVFRGLGEALLEMGAADRATLSDDGRLLLLPSPLSSRVLGAAAPDRPLDRALLSLLPAALSQVEATLQPGDHLELRLLSSGTERAGSTPLGLGELLARYARLRWARDGRAAETTVEVDHLGRDAFKLDATTLHRRIDGPLRAHASRLAEATPHGWRANLTVWLSSSTGTAAMVSGLVAALARWQPRLVTASNPRQHPTATGSGSWSQTQCRVSQLHDLSGNVPLDAADLDLASRMAVTELRTWKDEFLEKRPKRAHEESEDEEQRFWFRKGQQEVLATVVVKGESGFRAHRGVNLEVSLPTGSLCAERNAVGSAIVANPRLLRKDIQAVAVLGLGPTAHRLGPCGACQEWLRKVAEVNPALQVLVFDDAEMKTVYHHPLPTL